jgi:peptidoglycan hydrolase-like protein with peptidoglycan-binding domain
MAKSMARSMTKSIVTGAVALALCAVAALPAPGQQSQSTPQWIRDLDMDAAPALGDGGVRRVQQELRKRGFDPGPIDGIYGPLTKEGVRSFQDRYGMRASGDIDNQTLFALGAVDLARPKAQDNR